MLRIGKLITTWVTEIAYVNFENYTYINKMHEHLCRQFLNKIYDHKLIKLNDVKSNFPGLDISYTAKDLIAYQVTSRTDNRKIIESLESVFKNKFHDTFTKGIRFLFLSDKKISVGLKAKKSKLIFHISCAPVGGHKKRIR